jgi:hypothetical protein
LSLFEKKIEKSCISTFKIEPFCSLFLFFQSTVPLVANYASAFGERKRARETEAGVAEKSDGERKRG